MEMKRKEIECYVSFEKMVIITSGKNVNKKHMLKRTLSVRLYVALAKSVIGRHNPIDYRKIEYNWKLYLKRPEVVEI